MAVIDPKKLLPESTKTISILVPKKNVTAAASGVPALKPVAGPENLGSKLVIQKLIKIDEVLQDTLKLKKDKEKKEDQIEEKEDRKKREAALEKKDKGKKKSDKLFSIPKSGGLDWLSNWLQWTTIGFLFNNFKGLLDYIAPIWNNVIKPLGKILYNIFTAIVSGVTFFIDLGYDAYKGVESLIGDIGGEDAKEEFNKATGALTTAFNVAIIGLMIAASTRPGGKPGTPGTSKPGRGGVRPGTGGRPKVTTSGGGRAGGSGLRNPLRQTPNVTSGSGASRVTGAVGNRLTGRGAAKVTTSAAGKIGLKTAGRALKPILGRLPVIGGLIEFLISWAMGDPIGKAAFRGVGATLFAALGGIIGSVVPVFGTAIGAALGGFAGGEAGGLLYDVMFGGKNAKPKVEARAEGGQVGSKNKPKGNRSVGRREKKTKVSKVNKTQTLPGKDFAGRKKIEEFYGKDAGFLGSGFGAKQETPYDALYQSSQIAKQNRALNGVIGSLIGTGIDLTLGQKPSSSTIKEISNTLSTFVQASMQTEMDGTVKDIRQMFALENGGKIPSRSIGKEKNNSVFNMKQNLEMGISSSIQKTSTEIFSKIRNAMFGKKKADKERDRSEAQNTPGSFSGDGGFNGAANNYGMAQDAVTNTKWKAILNMLASVESINGSYSSAYNPAGSKIIPGLEEMTIKDAVAASGGVSPDGKHYAIGRYQFTTLTTGQARLAGLSDDDIFSPANQDQMAIALIEKKKGITFDMIRNNPDLAQLKLAEEWAGIPKDASGKSYYGNDGVNAAHISHQSVRSVFDTTLNKGITTVRPGAPGPPGGGVVQGNPIITSYYGEVRGNRTHNGVDVAAASGTPLTAVNNGMFVSADVDPGGWGMFIVYRVGSEFHLYGHLSKYAGLKAGDMVVKGGIVGYVGSTGRSSAPHLHWEMGSGYRGVIDNPKDPLSKYTYKQPFTIGQPQKAQTTPAPVSTAKLMGVGNNANYDVVIPLDHTKKAGTVPDTPGGSTFKNSNATGADGRERTHQDKAAKIIAARLGANGLRVRVMAPEEFNSYQDYDKALKKYAAQGVRIVPLHFDAIRGAGGTGFLTRTRAGDTEDAAFASPIQAVLKEFQRNNPDLGNISSDTMDNATINRAAASPAALVELGVMVDWEKKYGKNFTKTDKFMKFANDVADAILKGGGFKPQTQASVAPLATREVASLQRTPEYAEGQTTIILQKELVMVG